MSRSAPLAIVLVLVATLLFASEAIFSFFLFSDPLVSVIAIWSLIGLVGGGALIYYTLIARSAAEPRPIGHDPHPGRLYRLGGEWICKPCDDLVTDRVGVGGGMPIGNWLPRMFPRLFGRQEKVRREGLCDACGRAGWYLE